MFIYQRTSKTAGFSAGQVPAGSALGLLQFGQQGKTPQCQHWPSLTKYLSPTKKPKGQLDVETVSFQDFCSTYLI